MQFGAKMIGLSELIKNKYDVPQANKNIVRAIRVLYHSSQDEERRSTEKPKPTVLIMSETT